MGKILPAVYLTIWGIVAMVQGVEYSDDGLVIRWLSVCNYDQETKIQCQYGNFVRVEKVIDGTKIAPCSENCCQWNKTSDCYLPSRYTFFQKDICSNKTVCNIFKTGGSGLGCGISTYVAVGFVCVGDGGPTTTESTTESTTEFTTESTTTLPSTHLPREGGIQKDETSLGLALGVSVGCTVLLCLILLLVIYLRYYRGKKDFRRASKTPPSVTELGIKVDKSQNAVNSMSRFKLDKDMFTKGSWSNTGYKQFGISGQNPNMSYSFLSPGNLWKQASWLSALNNYSELPGSMGSYQPKHLGKQGKGNPYSKSHEEDGGSLGSADDLNALPDIHIFSIPEGRASPDSGVDNIGYIFPVIKEPTREDNLGHLQKLELETQGEKADNNGLELTMIFQPKPHIGDELKVTIASAGTDQQSLIPNINNTVVTKSPDTNDSFQSPSSEFFGKDFSQMGTHDDMLY